MAACECFSTWRTYCLITGACRSIGRACAIEIAKVLKRGSVVVLLAKSEEELKETRVSMSHIPIIVKVYPVDLPEADGAQYAHVIQDSLDTLQMKPSEFDHAMIVHNAGTLGDITKRAVRMDDLKNWEDYFRFNVFSTTILTSKFFGVFTEDQVKRRTVVNMTSLCAIQPFKTFSQYCTGKASRDMFFKVLALEEPSIKVLNFSPGPVETDLVDNLIEDSIEGDLRESFIATRKEKTHLTSEEAIKKLIKILAYDKFTSGDHIDYFDIVGQ